MSNSVYANPSGIVYNLPGGGGVPATPATATAPGAPTGVMATAGNAQAVLGWTAPASNGGSAITGYSVVSIPATTTQSFGTGTTQTFTGLTNGTAYTFEVAATNAIGTGSYSSASNSVTPSSGGVTNPGVPQTVLLVNQGGPTNQPTSSNTSLTNYQAIQWGASTPGTNSISYYKIYRNGTSYDTQGTQTVFHGYISGTTLTVTSVTSGTVLPGVNYSASGLTTGTLINTIQNSGTTGGVGSYPVNISQTTGSSGSPVTFSAWQYIDSSATNSNDPNTWALPATTYLYTVSAVDSAGNEGTQSSQFATYAYRLGYSNWNNVNLDYGGTTSTYNSTAGSPVGSLYDLSIYFNGGALPVASGQLAPVNNLELGAFNYMTMDINPGPGTVSGYQMYISHLSRLPPGDVASWGKVSNAFTTYGPAPIANTWATYKIPLSALTFGTCGITASISGTTLTVTSVNTGASVVDAGGFITGSGVPSGTYITGYNQSGAVGTFTLAGPGISGSTSVASTAMTFRRSSLYKFDLIINGGYNPTMYFNNIGWTVS